VLETVEDVGAITFIGDRHREIDLLLNADRLNAYGLTVDQVRSAVQRQDVEVPGGSFISGPAEIDLRTMGRMQRVDDFNRIILAYTNGSVVTFGDVGRVVDGVQEIRSAGRLDGTPAVSLLIQKQSGTNTVDVVDRVLARVEAIRRTLPADIRVQPIRDQSRFIRRSFEDIKLHLILGSLLASLVVFLFMRNPKVTLIAALAIPTSIVGTFAVMKAFGFTLNNMTMLALSLATGIVIDDAIVVLENIFRYVEEKDVTPHDAAIKATEEIGLAVMATTLSLCVIFLPVAFMTGQVGRYFYSFGITSAAAILISMLVSFTLTPTLCSMWLKKSDAHGHGGAAKSRGFYAWLDRRYGRMLHWALTHRLAMAGIAGAVVASALLLYPHIGKELVPDDDQSEFSVNVKLPSGTSYPRTEEYMADMERQLRRLPGVDLIFTNVNAGNANFYVGLTPLEQRSMSQQDVMRRARAALAKYKAARTRITGGTDISGASATGGGGGGGGGGYGNRLQALIQGPDLEQLQTYTTELIARVKEIPGVADVDSNFDATKPELRVNVDRARSADLGVPIDTLATNLRTLVGGEEVSKYKDGDDQYSVVLRLDEQFRDNPALMGNLLVPSNSQRAPARQRRRAAEHGLGARLDRSVQPATADYRDREPRRRPTRRRARGHACQGRGDAPQARLPGGVRRQRAHAQRSVERLRDRHLPRGDVHLHGARLAVQQLRLAPVDHVVAAAQPARGPARADGVRDDAERVQRHRHADAVRHREEELHPAGGLHQHAARAGDRAARGDRRRQPRAAAAHPDDDPSRSSRACCRSPSAAAPARVARVDGGHDSRRPGAVPAPDAARHAVVYSYFDDLREIDWFAFARRWTSIGVYGRRDSTAQADQLHDRSRRPAQRPAHLRELLLDRAHAVRLHAHLLRGDAAVGRELREAESDHVVRAPVRARVVVPVQFVPNLVAALQEHMRVFSESYSNVGWSKGPVH
jgi:hypothetical protein